MKTKVVVLGLMCVVLSELLTASVVHAWKRSKDQPVCSTCRIVVENFKKGLDRTKRSAYADGTAKWDQRNVQKKSSAVNREVRLVHIMDDLCYKADDECPPMVEEHEEEIEKYWFNPNTIKDEQEFFKFFCIETAKVCCPNNTYGPLCKECPGGLERPCSGNGLCSGESTREGNGNCFCKIGYEGELCERCSQRYFELFNNGTHLFCEACHQSCQSSCTGYKPSDCTDCKDGWRYNEQLGCREINECLEKPCGEKEYCNNTEGSYSCLSCHIACGECYGPGHNKCRVCSEGFLKKDNSCLDINECESYGKDKTCPSEGQQCENVPGSYVCTCQPGYVNDSAGLCVREDSSPQETQKSSKETAESTEALPVQKPKLGKKAQKGFPDCKVCTDIATNFMLGLESTKNSNYGGGNTKWEESRLGSYSESEMRLLEIVEGLCFRAGWQCQNLVEEYEDLIEEFWFNPAFRKQANIFFIFFCIQNVKACCPNNTFGPTCEDCLGGRDRPCKDNGICDGIGTREGTGKCNCSIGYEGDRCDSCAELYFESHRNDTHTVCKACHKSCNTSCTGDGAKDCNDCRDGWLQSVDAGCEDIDECASNPCSEKEYCKNTEGSYLCKNCDVSCLACDGPTSSNCKGCSDGFVLNGTKCSDIDECTGDGHEGLCTAEGQQCLNILGSYICVCETGYTEDVSGSCILDHKEEMESGNPPAEDEIKNSKDIPREEL